MGCDRERSWGGASYTGLGVNALIMFFLYVIRAECITLDMYMMGARREKRRRARLDNHLFAPYAISVGGKSLRRMDSRRRRDVMWLVVSELKSAWWLVKWPKRDWSAALNEEKNLRYRGLRRRAPLRITAIRDDRRTLVRWWFHIASSISQAPDHQCANGIPAAASINAVCNDELRAKAFLCAGIQIKRD